MPAIFLVGFVPMLLVAYAYRRLNQAVPDAGTSFTWTVKAFGPHVGWMCGWGLVIATIIVLSNLAGVAVTFFYLFLAEVLGDASIATWGDGNSSTSPPAWPSSRWRPRRLPRHDHDEEGQVHPGRHPARGPRALHRLGLRQGVRRRPTAIDFELAWLNPFSSSPSPPSRPRSRCRSSCTGAGTPPVATTRRRPAATRRRVASVLSLMILVILYVLVAISAQMFAGTGGDGLGLGNPETSDNVFAALADPVLGGTPAPAVPRRARELHLEPADDVHPGGAHDARDERLQGAAAVALGDPPDAQDPEPRDARLRHRHRGLLHGDDARERGRPGRHDPLARPDDLLLLRPDRVRGGLVLPPRPHAQRQVLLLKGVAPLLGGVRSARSSSSSRSTPPTRTTAAAARSSASARCSCSASACSRSASS